VTVMEDIENAVFCVYWFYFSVWYWDL